GFVLNNHTIKLSKIGNVNLRIGKNQNKIDGNIKTLTIKRMPSGKWFALFSCGVDIKTKYVKRKNVGIDVGLENFAMLSDGTTIENHRFLVNSEKKLKTLSRRLNRKKKGSNGRHDSRIKIARMYEKISNQRHDFMHKTTRRIVNKFGHISVEDLNIKGIIKHPYLAKHVNDASWGNFVRILDYKAESAGGQVIKVNPKGTSQICNRCKTKVPKTLATRWHRCPICGLHMHRDLNASKNILNATAGTAERYADGDRSSSLRNQFESSLPEKSEARQLVDR
ncbi:MAG: transposase, partial [Candidatus Aenigmatarchaeota archaeon]